jgi:hypothetical protein
MASRKSAPKSTARKATRPEKKPATKSKSASAKATDRARSGGAATKAKAAKSAATPKSRPSKAVDTKARDAKKPAPSAARAAKATKATRSTAATPDTDKTTPRARGKGADRKAATQETRTPTSPQTKRARGKGAAKPVEAAKPVAPARKRGASAGPPRTVAVTVGSEIVSKLGRKWNCFQCSASFYDLNRPEPLCPKCGADQRQRPKATASTPAHPPAPRKQPRPMAPLLDDEDDGTVRYDEEFDLGVRTDVDDTEQDLFPPGDVEEDDVFGAEED